VLRLNDTTNLSWDTYFHFVSVTYICGKTRSNILLLCVHHCYSDCMIHPGYFIGKVHVCCSLNTTPRKLHRINMKILALLSVKTI
jgi:hypothetical protein